MEIQIGVTRWITHLIKLSSHYQAICDENDGGNCFPAKGTSHMPKGDGYFGAAEGVNEGLLKSWIVQIDEVRFKLADARNTSMRELNDASEAHQNAYSAVVVRQAEQSMTGGDTGGLNTDEIDTNGDADVGIATRKNWF